MESLKASIWGLIAFLGITAVANGWITQDESDAIQEGYNIVVNDAESLIGSFMMLLGLVRGLPVIGGLIGGTQGNVEE